MVEANTTTTKVDIFLSAKNLVDLDTFSKSDPFCTLLQQLTPGGPYTVVGSTEVIKNDLNPNWNTSFQLDYFFEASQPLRFIVYDFDRGTSDDLGIIDVLLGELVRKKTSFLNLTNEGKLIVRVEEVRQSKEKYMLSLRGVGLDKKDTFGKSDPYLVFYRSLGHNQWIEVKRTEIINDTLDPVWAPVGLTDHQLCNSDRSKPIKIECYDWDKVGSDEFIGSFETTLSSLTTPGSTFKLTLPGKNRFSGTILISDCRVKKSLTFIDYLHKGLQISFSVAIDFTQNHIFTEDQTSDDYEDAIWEIGSILEAYDSDRNFPVYGFGGIPPGGSISQCFPLTGDSTSPYVNGARGILKIYHSSIGKISQSSPGELHYIIDELISSASSISSNNGYYVLLILTNGEISDIDQTINSIVRASSLPISIIILGIGNSDFDVMKKLDCDGEILIDNSGNKALRDIVQFVNYNSYQGKISQLACEVLKEVPNQVTSYMQMIDFMPEVVKR
ncbi:hypothetical protein SteCoe_13851 [Stentor coeruleus]|uniref:C2 domain-containing protein n=1 Tax=Stentor coeruleus TaxID=5963 RepID=A0A1R2C7F0_9CILI|nr:hypothetical protein SteCoe_13851 [Stentor coeruleus]